MEIFFTRPWLKVISGLFTNLAAGWIGAAFITPTFANPSSPEVILALTKDIISAIMCMLIAVRVERILEE